jgi:WD40 repeat protein
VQQLKGWGNGGKVIFSPDGKRVFTALSLSPKSRAQIWDPTSGQAITPAFDGFPMAVSPDGKLVATRIDQPDQDGVRGWVHTWDAATGKPVATIPLDGVAMDVQFSPDALHVLTISGTAARLWNARTGQAVVPPLFHDTLCYLASFSKDGKSVATAGSGDVRIWDTANGLLRTRPLKLPTPGGGVYFVTFSPDGTQVVVVGTWNKRWFAQVWEAAKGKEVKKVIAPLE